MIIGLLGGLIGYFGVYELKKRTNVDDSLDTFGVHGLAGIWGAIATGIFANPEVNEAGTGLWYGNPNQIIIQLQAIGVTIVYSAVMTVAIYYLTSLMTRGMRVNEEMELKGIDQSFHGESAS
jgi:Amt family ammonium transporter